MRAMAHPAASIMDAFTLCLNGIVNPLLKQRILEIKASFLSAETEYSAAGSAGHLYMIPANHQRGEEIAIGRVTKGELKEMYTYYLVDKSKPGRSVYDLLLTSAPNGICPLCGVGQAATLDHFLPKAKFPIYSVLPLNLIPACRDCNTGKLATFATSYGEQSLHPYFDHGIFVNEQWLSASVMHTTPASISFFVSAPTSWAPGDQARAESHFLSLRLGERFAVLAASELTSINAMLKSYISGLGSNAVREYLNACAIAEFGLHRNSWKTAMLFALAADDWYCQGGFRLT